MIVSVVLCLHLSGHSKQFEPLGDSSGYFSRFNRTALIHINESLPYKKQIAACAHELGHVMLHPDTNMAFLKSKTYFPTSKIEAEANEFMIELLFNQGIAKAITFCEATEKYGIPVELIKSLYGKKI